MKQLLTILIFASPVLAEPVCEKWMRECHREAFAERHCAGWTDVCTKWHETPTPIATVTPGPIRLEWNHDLREICRFSSDIEGRLIVSSKSDAEALKALGLKMCEGR